MCVCAACISSRVDYSSNYACVRARARPDFVGKRQTRFSARHFCHAPIPDYASANDGAHARARPAAFAECETSTESDSALLRPLDVAIRDRTTEPRIGGWTARIDRDGARIAEPKTRDGTRRVEASSFIPVASFSSRDVLSKGSESDVRDTCGVGANENREKAPVFSLATFHHLPALTWRYSRDVWQIFRCPSSPSPSLNYRRILTVAEKRRTIISTAM